MLIVTSYPGQSLRLIEAPEHLIPYLLADGKSIPFVRRATKGEVETATPLSDSELELKRLHDKDPRWGSW
jgi:hypothetical protein